MKDKIIRSDHAVTLVGGGDVGPEDLALALKRAPLLAAADAGAATALEQGHMPTAVIGDFDSLSGAHRASLPPEILFRISEQDTTDFEKALSRIAAPLVIAVGFLGHRVDHQLAAFNTLVRLHDHRCLLIGRHEVIFHLPPRIEVALEPGDTVSLFPLRDLSGRSTGLEWPIEGLDFSAGGRIGTSNRAQGAVTLDTSGPGLLAMMPRRRLDAVIDAVRFLTDVHRS